MRLVAEFKADISLIVNARLIRQTGLEGHTVTLCVHVEERPVDLIPDNKAVIHRATESLFRSKFC